MDTNQPRVGEHDDEGDDRRVIDAIRNGNTTAMLLLVLTQREEGAVDICVALKRFRDSQQRSLAHLAIQVDNMEVLDFLLANGFDPDSECEDSEGNTPMTLAVLGQNLDAMRLLVSYGSSVSECDGDLYTLLHLLAMNSTEDEGDSCADGAQLVDLIVRSGDVDINARDSSGNTPLHLAAVYGSPSIASRLVQVGANINAMNDCGSTPLHFAAATGDVLIVEYLTAAGAEVNQADAWGNTPLIDAAFVNQSASPHFAFGDSITQSRAVKLLLENGADPEAVNLEGNNALFGAVRNGFEDVIDQLSRYQMSCCFQLRNNQQETLLHVAARAQVTNVSIWEKLLKYCGRGSVSALDQFERTCVGIWMAWPQSFGDQDGESGSDDGSSLPRRAVEAHGIQAVSRLLLSIK